MTEEEREKIADAAVLAYQIEAKKSLDAEQLAHYERNLRAKRKHYTQSAEAYSTGGQKSRAMAAGAAVLKGLEQLEKFRREHRLIPGTLSWIIGEDRAMDPDGKKGYRYAVIWHVLADEPALTEEKIEKELKETRERIAAETREMFADMAEEEDGEPGEAEGAGVSEVSQAQEKDAGNEEEPAQDDGPGNPGAE